jgi:hypothetical protein
MISFLNYYELDKPTRIEIDQINNLKDDKLFVLVCGDSNKATVSEKFIQLSAINAETNQINEEIQSVLKGKESIILIENNDIEIIKERLLSAKKNFFTTIYVLVEAIQSKQDNKIILNELIQNNTLVDFYVYLKR